MDQSAASDSWGRAGTDADRHGTGTISVLHVDDEPDFADMVAGFLERESDRIRVETATSAADALTALDETTECIISDYDMPGTNGIELLEAVREEFPDLPFLLFTGKGSEEIASEAISAGVTDYLQKETGTDHYALLANRVENSVERYRSQRTLERRKQELEAWRERVEFALDATDSYIYEVDLTEGTETRFGPFERIFGVPSESVPTTDAFYERALHPDDRDRLRSLQDPTTLADEHETVEYEYRTHPDNGDVRWLRSQFYVERTVDGEPTRMVGLATDVTERKEREQRLRETSARLEALFEHSPDMIDVHDADGRILDANRQLCAELGYDYDELVGKHVWDIDETVAPEDVRDIWADMATDDRYRLEGRYRRRDGSTFPVEVHLRRIQLDGDDRFVVISRDITERKERERKTEYLQDVTADLIRAESREDVARLAVEAADEVFSLPLSGIHLLGDDGTTLEGTVATAAVEDHFDGAPEYRSSDDSQPAALVWDVFEEGATHFITDVHDHGCLSPADTSVGSGVITALGDHGVLLASSTERDAIDGTDRALTEIFGAMVTAALDRVGREETVRTERDRFASLFEMIPEPMTFVRFENGDPILQDVNRAFEEVFGYDEADVVGRSANDVIVPGEKRTEAEDIDRTARTAGGVTREVSREAADGTREFLFRSAPVGDASETDEYFGIYVDVTERKERERQLERQNERLEQFTGIVSHDLRNPLQVIQGALEMAEETGQQEQFARCHRAVDRMQRLVDDLLTLARTGERVGDLSAVDLETVSRQCWLNVDTDAATLAVECDSTIRADPSRLEQLLTNLFTNAVEHGRPDVSVTVGEHADGSGFYVADDGPGIPEADRERVFEAGHSTASDGTGFGLFIVEQVADAHGWDVTVTTSDAGGARFEFTSVDVV